MKASAKEELSRAEALEQYEAIGAAPDPALAELTALAAELCGAPMAAISLLAPDAIYFIARVGAGPARLARGRMPCETCIHTDGVYEITDARYHKDFRPDGTWKVAMDASANEPPSAGDCCTLPKP